VNTSTLVDSGLTASQLVAFKKDVYNFKPSIQKLVIDSSSVSPGPHNKDDPNAQFSLNFKARADSQDYNFTLIYSDLDSVHTKIYDSFGVLVYDSLSQEAE
jgi:hypothetical protein